MTNLMMAHVSELSRVCFRTADSTASFTGGGTSLGDRAQKICLFHGTRPGSAEWYEE